MALAIALGAVVATDAGASEKLAWLGVGVAALMIAIGLAATSATPIHLGLGLLGALLVLRQDTRLLLAPIYGAGLLLVDELGSRSIELDSVDSIGPAVIGARAAAMLAVTGVGAGVGAVAAIVVTGAPGRSVALTAVGALALTAVFALIVRHVRGSYRPATAVDTRSDTQSTPPVSDDGTGGH